MKLTVIAPDLPWLFKPPTLLTACTSPAVCWGRSWGSYSCCRQFRAPFDLVVQSAEMVSRICRCQDESWTLSLCYNTVMILLACGHHLFVLDPSEFKLCLNFSLINEPTRVMQLGMVIVDNSVIRCSNHQYIRNEVRRLVQPGRPAMKFRRQTQGTSHHVR